MSNKMLGEITCLELQAVRDKRGVWGQLTRQRIHNTLILIDR